MVVNNSPILTTGISQFFGGIVLFIVAIIMGADLLRFDWWSLLVLSYICTASMSAYVLFGYILRTNNLSKLFIIKFTEPLFACIFSAVLLGEEIFKIQYLLAFILISIGVILGEKSEGKIVKENLV